MRATLLFAIGLGLVAGCLGAPASTTEAPIPGVLVVDRDNPSVPYEFTTAILEDGTYQHDRIDAFTQATITWWNVDDEVHSVVSDDGQFAGSGPIAPGGEFVRTFQTAGDYKFHCRYHANMTGIVVVR